MPATTYVRLTGPEGFPPLSLTWDVWRAAVGIGRDYSDGDDTYDLVTYCDEPVTLTTYALDRWSKAIQDWLKEHAHFIDNPDINEAIMVPLSRLVALASWTSIKGGVLNVSAPEEAKP